MFIFKNRTVTTKSEKTLPKVRHEKTIKARKIDTIFGIKITSTTEPRLLAEIKNRLVNGDKFFVTTPNPEILLLARKDRVLAKIINDSDYALPDGVGVIMAMRFLSLHRSRYAKVRRVIYLLEGLVTGASLLIGRWWLFRVAKQIKGRELAMKLISICQDTNKSVLLISPDKESGNRATEKLFKKYPKLSVTSIVAPVLDSAAKPVSQRDTLKYRDIIRYIQNNRPDLIMVGIGAPKQEKMLANIFKINGVRGGIVVGGTIDMIAGKRRVAPRLISFIGFEWVWRLLFHKTSRGESRFKRVMRSVVVFPLAVYRYKVALS